MRVNKFYKLVTGVTVGTGLALYGVHKLPPITGKRPSGGGPVFTGFVPPVGDSKRPWEYCSEDETPDMEDTMSNSNKLT